MLNFVKAAFRDFLEVVLWINLVAWAIIGYKYLSRALEGRPSSFFEGPSTEYLFLGVIVGLIIGMLTNIVGGGLIATILNIDANLKKIIDENLENIDGKLKKIVNNTKNSGLSTAPVPNVAQYQPAAQAGLVPTVPASPAPAAAPTIRCPECNNTQPFGTAVCGKCGFPLR